MTPKQTTKTTKRNDNLLTPTSANDRRTHADCALDVAVAESGATNLSSSGQSRIEDVGGPLTLTAAAQPVLLC